MSLDNRSIAGTDAPASEPTQESCTAAINAARTLAEALPVADLSRYIAERDLAQALAEASNGEFDDCLEWADRAALEVRERYHSAQSGESLVVLPTDK
jgi:tRNA C32,U32 (ribose-2'-O)-methylase TrmJ